MVIVTPPAGKLIGASIGTNLVGVFSNRSLWGLMAIVAAVCTVLFLCFLCCGYCSETPSIGSVDITEPSSVSENKTSIDATAPQHQSYPLESNDPSPGPKKECINSKLTHRQNI